MEPRQYFGALRKRWAWMLVAALAGGAAGLGLSAVMTPKYQATAKVFMAASKTQTTGELVQGNTYTQNVAQSYARLAEMPVVLDPVAQQLSFNDGAAGLAKRVKAQSVLDTSLIEITANSTSPTTAADIANGVANQLPRTVESLAPRTKDDETPLKVTVVSRAVAPSKPFQPDPKLNVGGGMFLGLLLSMCIIVLRELLDNRVRTEDDAKAAASVPVLASVPFIGKSSSRKVHGTAFHQAEAFRQLRTNLQYLSYAGGLRSLVVTSSQPAEGKTTTAVNLARTMAAAGAVVLLVDADLRLPAVSRALGIEGSVGLSTILIGQAEAEDVVQQWGEETLYVLPSGQTPPNPSELLASERMSNLMDLLVEQFDLVILDAAPLLPVTDPTVLASICDGALVVVSAKRTTRQELSRAASMLTAAGARLLGIVLNQVPAAKHNAYYGQSAKNLPKPPLPSSRLLNGEAAKAAGSPAGATTSTSTAGPPRSS